MCSNLFRSRDAQDYRILLSDDDLIFDADTQVVEMLWEQGSRRNINA
jgi:hypothetical protein